MNNFLTLQNYSRVADKLFSKKFIKTFCNKNSNFIKINDEKWHYLGVILFWDIYAGKDLKIN
jgi:hypothetical protein